MSNQCICLTTDQMFPHSSTALASQYSGQDARRPWFPRLTWLYGRQVHAPEQLVFLLMLLIACCSCSGGSGPVMHSTQTVTPAQLSISTTSMPQATAGMVYSMTLVAQGGVAPYTWSLASGQLPAGLQLSSSGVISGTSTGSGNFSFTVQVKDSDASPQSASQPESIVVGAAPSSSTVTPPPQATGYSLKFSDDFTSLDISPDREGTHNWYEGLWWRSTISPMSNITESNSILNLNWVNGQGVASTDVTTCSLSGQNCKTFRYGYFEARMQWTPVPGAWPAFWLIPIQNISNPSGEHGEIDVFEGLGATPHTYYGTIHDWIGNRDVYNNGSSNAYPLPGTTDLTQFHIYGALWTPGKVSWYFDNQLLGSAATDSTFDQQDFYLVLSSQEGVGFAGGNMNGVTPSSIPLNVDWVHVFQP